MFPLFNTFSLQFKILIVNWTELNCFFLFFVSLCSTLWGVIFYLISNVSSSFFFLLKWEQGLGWMENEGQGIKKDRKYAKQLQLN